MHLYRFYLQHMQLCWCGDMRVRGSYTVEAALIVPTVLFVLLFIMNQGISLYEETVKMAEKQSRWESFQPAEHFRFIEGIRKPEGEDQEESKWK